MSPSDPATDLANAINADDQGAFVNGSMAIMTSNAGLEGAGRMLGRGIESLLAARSAIAAKARVDLENLSATIKRQVASRDWTTQDILDTVRDGEPHATPNKMTGGAAVEYVPPPVEDSSSTLQPGKFCKSQVKGFHRIT
jgi:hypothetical protein